MTTNLYSRYNKFRYLNGKGMSWPYFSLKILGNPSLLAKAGISVTLSLFLDKTGDQFFLISPFP